MSSINETYQFFIDFPRNPNVQVYPEIESLVWTWKEQRNQKFWTLELDTDLVFTDNATSKIKTNDGFINGHDTFAELYELEQRKNVCFFLDIRINYLSSAGTWIQCYEGFIPWRKGRWSFSEATVTIKPRSSTPMNCVLDNWNEKRNLLEVTEKVKIDTIVGELEYKQRRLKNEEPLTPEGAGWINYERWVEDEFLGNPSTGRYLNTIYTYQYVRERWTGVSAPTDSTWIFENGEYYRSPAIGDPREEETEVIEYDQSNEDPDFYFIGVRVTYKIIDFNIDNGIPLGKAIEYLLEPCGLNFASNFFNINPISEDIFIEEYELAAEDYSNIVIFQASDIIRSEADINATRLDKSLKQLIGDMMKKHPLYLFYDSVNDVIRLEHEEYRSRRLMLDLTQLSEDIEGFRNYEYDDEDFPILETFRDLFEGEFARDFGDATFSYAAGCSSNNEADQQKDIKLENIIYDVGAVYNNEELIEDKSIRTAIVMVSLNEDSTIVSGPGAITGNQILNSPFAWANVLERYHMHGRPLTFGKVNDKTVIFKSTKPVRKQDTIEVTMKRDDFFGNFLPTDKVKTQFGWGEVDKVTYEAPGNILSIDPKFRIK